MISEMLTEIRNSGIKVIDNEFDAVDRIMYLEVDCEYMTALQFQVIRNAIDEEREYRVEVTLTLKNKPAHI